MACVNICITGPESTGKSTLTKDLSGRFGFPYVEEQARKFLDELGRKHVFEDLAQIAELQLKAIKEAASINDIIFSDTDLLTIKIWAQDKYEKEISFVEEHYQVEKADLYLLCYPDLEWQHDDLREDENRLYEIHLFYLGVLEFMGANYVVIKGKGDQRLENARKAVKEFLENQH